MIVGEECVLVVVVVGVEVDDVVLGECVVFGVVVNVLLGDCLGIYGFGGDCVFSGCVGIVEC